MRHHSLTVGILAISLMAGVATAQAGTETWVSASGSNVGTCPITAPCKTFAYAHDQTTAQGAINVLTSGNYGPLTITKAISIVADEVEAVINTAAGGAAIVVSAPLAAVVSLRGLTIDLRGTSNAGINFVSGAALHVHNSAIRKVTDGIIFAPSSGTRELYISDSTVADDAGTGIFVGPNGSAGAKVVLDRVRVENCTNGGIVFQGIFSTSPITATVRDSVSVGNSLGIFVSENGGGTTTAMVDRTTLVNNGAGVFVDGAGATVRIGASTVSGNSTGLLTSGAGAIESYGTNQVNGNDTDGAPTSTIAMK